MFDASFKENSAPKRRRVQRRFVAESRPLAFCFWVAWLRFDLL
jgi:hypothetical protein